MRVSVWNGLAMVLELEEIGTGHARCIDGFARGGTSLHILVWGASSSGNPHYFPAQFAHGFPSLIVVIPAGLASEGYMFEGNLQVFWVSCQAIRSRKANQSICLNFCSLFRLSPHKTLQLFDWLSLIKSLGLTQTAEFGREWPLHMSLGFSIVEHSSNTHPPY